MMNKLLDRLYEWMQSFIPFVVVTLLLISCRSQQPMTLSENTESDRQTVTNRNEHTDKLSVLQQDIDMFTEQWKQKYSSYPAAGYTRFIRSLIQRDSNM